MKTLIAIYDENPVLNVYAATVFKPDNIIILENKRIKQHQSQRTIKNFLLSRKLTDKVSFRMFREYSVEGILETFRDLSDEFDDCVVDLTCDDMLVSFAAGQLSKEKDIQFFTYNHILRSFRNILNFNVIGSGDMSVKLNIKDFMRLAGGSVVTHGHFNPHDYDEYSDEFIDTIWNLYLSHKHDWNRFVAYIQHYVDSSSDSIHFCGKEHVSVDNYVLYCCYGILNDLEKIGIIKDLEVNQGKVCFEFMNLKIRRLLCDVGVWLELYTYRTACSCDEFDDVDMSVVIDWNGIENEYDDVTNEIDVIVTKGIVPMFISCKSGNVNTAALNEIHTLASRFGGKYGKAVILTATQLSEESPRSYRRALEMGITVIEREDLSVKKLSERLMDIMDRN